MGTPQSQLDPIAVALMARNAYANSARQVVDAVFGSVTYKTNGRGSVPIPNEFLLEGVTAHLSLTVTTNSATGYTYLADKALIEELDVKIGSDSQIATADSLYLDQHMLLENPGGNMGAANNLPSTISATMNIDAYFDVPVVYSPANLMGLQNINAKNIHPSVAVKFGDVANMFIGGTGATATGYIEFIAKRTLPPNTPQEGSPDLSKVYAYSYQDFALTGSKNNYMPLELDNTVTRIVINFLEGGTGNGSDVASYDSTNALQVQELSLGWSGFMDKFNEVPYWWFQQEAAKNYGLAFSKYINRGTVVLDLDRWGGRDWIDAANLTQFKITANLGAAPPNGSKARVYTEQIINTSQIPIRG